MNNVKVSGYGDYSSCNYGVNSLKVTIGRLTIYFSYSTPIAYEFGFDEFAIRKNLWGPTTGKHLNWIDDDKSKRIDGREFEKKLDIRLAELGLTSNSITA